MKKLIISCTILLVASVAAFGQRYTTYNNDRFAFSIEYPSSLLTPQRAPTNNDGRTFRSKDRAVEMRAWGQFNALSNTLSQEYDDAVKDSGSGVTYKKLLGNSFVISGRRGTKIFYRKTLYRKNGDAFYTFTIEYPKSQKSRYDAIVNRIARSFRFDPNATL